ncbi:hypothetical protein R3P38DRAFT_2777248 [Favolaschia claudopus]|uniref:Uncharacterized protein n=1 Tax=Favolaschia claudopus TaxID=2862362 RepID=A0AAW0BL31_9AGAR
MSFRIFGGSTTAQEGAKGYGVLVGGGDRWFHLMTGFPNWGSLSWGSKKNYVRKHKPWPVRDQNPSKLKSFPTFLGEFRFDWSAAVVCRQAEVMKEFASHLPLVLSAKLGVLGALVVITRIKSGNLVLPGERRYNISAEESKDTLPPYQNLESPPPYNGARHVEFTRPTNILTSGTPEVAGPLDEDICSASGTSTQPTQQRGREAGRQYELQLETFPALCTHRTSHPMHRPHVAAAASFAVPGRITSSSSRTNGPVPRTKIVGLKSLIASSAELGCVENV